MCLPFFHSSIKAFTNVNLYSYWIKKPKLVFLVYNKVTVNGAVAAFMEKLPNLDLGSSARFPRGIEI